MSRVENKLDLDRIVFIGRSYEEYMEMFSLNEELLNGKKILDCPAGACSFTAIASEKGYDVTACDLVYSIPAEQIKKKGLHDIHHVIGSMNDVKDSYVWEFHKNLDQLNKHRKNALLDFVEHFGKFPSKYVTAILPQLPFQNEQFNITLSAHFLFTYGDRLDYSFHIETIKELLRVTKNEVRIFPLVDLEGKRSPYIDQLLAELKDLIDYEEVNVPYEFQKHANTMLKLYKKRKS
ncbi:SAM-dependent methyltransferase [Metabacillus niabensis]|uniref:Ubiquinone/menaquinone biosynthesis C-methylase UbiE n=1 Tax=Metabacillus niabensis TaxID=324854 RepID=A0ABT9YVU9_9BACI|nr:SAM-dependent methyltransferase [Metabacillus niabensis]MDQ0223731.1 ubiquinone/menaquinone biosynthesis C-methylase UbiE [Metabacillus niabensis]PAD67874.1 SAM-dependent methyltransferase [Bacillus sp. 7586-K]